MFTFRVNPAYSDEIESGRLLIPHTTDILPFDNGESFHDGEEISNFIALINTLRRTNSCFAPLAVVTSGFLCNRFSLAYSPF